MLWLHHNIIIHDYQLYTSTQVRDRITPAVLAQLRGTAAHRHRTPGQPPAPNLDKLMQLAHESTVATTTTTCRLQRMGIQPLTATLMTAWRWPELEQRRVPERYRMLADMEQVPIRLQESVESRTRESLERVDGESESGSRGKGGCRRNPDSCSKWI